MNNSNIRIYQSEDGETELNVQLNMETVWLSLNQMVELFERDKSLISRHIGNIFKEKELKRDSVVAKNATTALCHYHLIEKIARIIFCLWQKFIRLICEIR